MVGELLEESIMEPGLVTQLVQEARAATALALLCSQQHKYRVTDLLYYNFGD